MLEEFDRGWASTACTRCTSTTRPRPRLQPRPHAPLGEGGVWQGGLGRFLSDPPSTGCPCVFEGRRFPGKAGPEVNARSTSAVCLRASIGRTPCAVSRRRPMRAGAFEEVGDAAKRPAGCPQSLGRDDRRGALDQCASAPRGGAGRLGLSKPPGSYAGPVNVGHFLAPLKWPFSPIRRASGDGGALASLPPRRRGRRAGQARRRGAVCACQEERRGPVGGHRPARLANHGQPSTIASISARRLFERRR